MDRHLLALAQIVLVTSQLVTHLLDREATPVESSSLAILGEQQVVVVEGGRCADS